MDGINIKKSEALEVLIMKIQCDVCWNRHIFQCLIFLRWGKTLWSISLHRLRSKENGIQLSCVGRCLNVYFDVNDGRLSNSINSLEHRCNLARISLFYCNYNGFCLSKIRGLIAVNHVFLCNTRLSWQAHLYVLDCPLERKFHDKHNSSFSRTIRLWNSPRTEVVISWFLNDAKGKNYRNIITCFCK